MTNIEISHSEWITLIRSGREGSSRSDRLKLLISSYYHLKPGQSETRSESQGFNYLARRDKWAQSSTKSLHWADIITIFIWYIQFFYAQLRLFTSHNSGTSTLSWIWAWRTKREVNKGLSEKKENCEILWKGIGDLCRRAVDGSIYRAACAVVHKGVCEEAICHLALRSSESQRVKWSQLEKTGVNNYSRRPRYCYSEH